MVMCVRYKNYIRSLCTRAAGAAQDWAIDLRGSLWKRDLSALGPKGPRRHLLARVRKSQVKLTYGLLFAHVTCPRNAKPVFTRCKHDRKKAPCFLHAQLIWSRGLRARAHTHTLGFCILHINLQLMKLRFQAVWHEK